MRIVCVGGGPAGLYFAICAKRRDPGRDVTVLERDQPGAAPGWGVIYWDPLLNLLFRNDPTSAQTVRAASTLWQGQRLIVGGSGTAHLPGYGFAVQRARLLDILAERASELGVSVRHGVEVDELSAYADDPPADLVLVADGANSRIRRQAAPERFRTRVDTGRNRFIWLGTSRRFDDFTFAFERTEHGWVWFHAYPSSEEISTCIVECAPTTWSGLGLDRMDADAGLQMLSEVFAEPLAGEPLIGGRSARWQRFSHVTNDRWVNGNVALVGDAAHTTHFTLGSGTALAMRDSAWLARALDQFGEVPAALQMFDVTGRQQLARAQAVARTSMAWFEQVDRWLAEDDDPVALAYSMATRQGHAPPLGRQVLAASQRPAVRRAQRRLGNCARWLQARRRGERPEPVDTRTAGASLARAT
ncbi:MAG: FAD-dependent monooxygenase [Frankia sp.]|nr:FAD-dependent monooxygenase [Frankia sp.]